jgi:hypothetical protein
MVVGGQYDGSKVATRLRDGKALILQVSVGKGPFPCTERKDLYCILRRIVDSFLSAGRSRVLWPRSSGALFSPQSLCIRALAKDVVCNIYEQYLKDSRTFAIASC